MLVAVMDHVLGTSTFFCSKMTSPDSLVIAAVRYSHSTASNGGIPSCVKYRLNSSPFLDRSSWPSVTVCSKMSSFMAISRGGIHPSLYQYVVCSYCLILPNGPVEG